MPTKRALEIEILTLDFIAQLEERVPNTHKVLGSSPSKIT